MTSFCFFDGGLMALGGGSKGASGKDHMMFPMFRLSWELSHFPTIWEEKGGSLKVCIRTYVTLKSKTPGGCTESSSRLLVLGPGAKGASGGIQNGLTLGPWEALGASSVSLSRLSSSSSSQHASHELVELELVCCYHVLLLFWVCVENRQLSADT